jgi:hypothetical protein
MSAEIEISADLEAFLSLRLGDMEAQILSNLEYIMPLEWGHSGQAPQGMVGAFINDYQDWFVAELRIALDTSDDLPKALEAGVTMAALQILRAIADRTPVDTGRAKNSWDVVLPDGTIVPVGPEITLEEQRAILHNRKVHQSDSQKVAAGKQADAARRRADRDARVESERARMRAEHEAGIKRTPTRKPRS